MIYEIYQYSQSHPILSHIIHWRRSICSPPTPCVRVFYSVTMTKSQETDHDCMTAHKFFHSQHCHSASNVPLIYEQTHCHDQSSYTSYTVAAAGRSTQAGRLMYEIPISQDTTEREIRGIANLDLARVGRRWGSRSGKRSPAAAACPSWAAAWAGGIAAVDAWRRLGASRGTMRAAALRPR